MPRKLRPAARRESSRGRTKLAVHRLRDGLTQQQMAEYSGVPIASYRRAERGERIPTSPELANFATVLGVPLEDLIEVEWRHWHVLSDEAAEPPPHWRVWHKLGKPPPAEYLEQLSPKGRAALLDKLKHGSALDL